MPFYAATKENPRLENLRLKDFRRDWCRQRRARVDWQGMMESCKGDMAWNPVKWDKIHRSDASTSEIVFWDIRPAGEFSKIFIKSKTSDNRTKMIGGDTWRVFLRGPSKLAATMFDHHNGTYEALFLLTEPGIYELMVYLDYSLCDGFRDPPRDWFINGDAQGKYQNFSILGRPIDHLLLQSFKNWLNITVPETQLNMSLIGWYRKCDLYVILQYQTLEVAFHQDTQHLEFCPKILHDDSFSFSNSLLRVGYSDETSYLIFIVQLRVLEGNPLIPWTY